MSDAVLLAIGGNSLIREGQAGSIDEQMANAKVLSAEIARLAASGVRVVVTHGNGPQVGFIMLRSQLMDAAAPVPRLRLDLGVADSQGGVGYILANAMMSELRRRDLGERVVCVLSHALVDADDPAFSRPTKPIGPWLSEEQAAAQREAHGWHTAFEHGRGHRRVVPSPKPIRIMEQGAVAALLDAGYIVIAGGGGGIPVVEEADGTLRGVEAVIDKDYASAVLAAGLGLRTLIITTGVERIALDFRRSTERYVDRLSKEEAARHLAEGQFPEGSMGPKVRAALEFLDAGGAEVLITSPFTLADALAGRNGTRITQ